MCKKFSKEVKVFEGDDKLLIYSDCVNCGRVLVETKELKMAPKGEGVTDWVKVFLGIFFVLSAGLSGFLFFRMNQYELVIAELRSSYSGLHSDYMSLLNTSSSLQVYYDELTNMYSVIRGEYSDLEGMYATLLIENAALQDELHEFRMIVNLERSMILESNRTVELIPKGNLTLAYDLEYAGLIELNFTASTDVYFWVGGSVDDNRYYARYPPFPNTAMDGSFKIPVVDVVYINVSNPNEGVGAVIYFSIKYVY